MLRIIVCLNWIDHVLYGLLFPVQETGVRDIFRIRSFFLISVSTKFKVRCKSEILHRTSKIRAVEHYFKTECLSQPPLSSSSATPR